MKRWQPSLALVLLLAAAGCLDDDITGTRPLTLQVEASATTVSVGEEIQFTVTATGTQLRQLTFDFGDGSTPEERTYPGAVMLTDIAVHSYETAGTYVTVVEAVANQGTVSDEVTVTVN
jgi:PKD repeat protein